MSWPVHAGKMAARARRRCVFCGALIRPCNLGRHVDAKHSARGARVKVVASVSTVLTDHEVQDAVIRKASAYRMIEKGLLHRALGLGAVLPSEIEKARRALDDALDEYEARARPS